MQRDYWWRFWRMNRITAGVSAGMFGSLAVLALVISICSAASSNAPGYVGWGFCCGLPWLLLAAPYVWQLQRLMQRDRLNAELGEVELTTDDTPETPPSQPHNRLYVPKSPPTNR